MSPVKVSKVSSQHFGVLNLNSRKSQEQGILIYFYVVLPTTLRHSRPGGWWQQGQEILCIRTMKCRYLFEIWFFQCTCLLFRPGADFAGISPRFSSPFILQIVLGSLVIYICLLKKGSLQSCLSHMGSLQSCLSHTGSLQSVFLLSKKGSLRLSSAFVLDVSDRFCRQNFDKDPSHRLRTQRLQFRHFLCTNFAWKRTYLI